MFQQRGRKMMDAAIMEMKINHNRLRSVKRKRLWTERRS